MLLVQPKPFNGVHPLAKQGRQLARQFLANPGRRIREFEMVLPRGFEHVKDKSVAPGVRLKQAVDPAQSARIALGVSGGRQPNGEHAGIIVARLA